MRWLPGIASGDIITSVAMTEPGTGSDLQGSAPGRREQGDGYVINGAKTFITNGQLCDMVVVVAKTDPGQGAKGISLLIVDANATGFRRGKVLDKVGQEGGDTSEMFFDDCSGAGRLSAGRRGRPGLFPADGATAVRAGPDRDRRRRPDGARA